MRPSVSDASPTNVNVEVCDRRRAVPSGTDSAGYLLKFAAGDASTVSRDRLPAFGEFREPRLG